ncbi:MAG: hypothetical protein PHX47_00200 [Candidatus ainarchaeum sp.]|nr:hypothetical protein [Candidatus ainarchaeum sp.]
MTTEINKKWNHSSSPIAKRKNKLQEKNRVGTISNSEKIELNNINIEYCKDMIRSNKGNKEFAEIILCEISSLQKKNDKLTKEINIINENCKKKKPKIKKGPKK